jgi:hypothetical protein
VDIFEKGRKAVTPLYQGKGTDVGSWLSISRERLESYLWNL